MSSRCRASVVCMALLAVTVFLHFHRQMNDDKERGFKYTTPNSLDSKEIMSNLNRAKVAAEDTKLLDLLRKSYIEVPDTAPYNLSQPEIENQSPGQTQCVDNLLNHKRNGFFVDCGAYDGEHLSNSLFLERYRNWTGILIEPNPMTFERLRRKHRKSYSLNACLSIKAYPVLILPIRQRLPLAFIKIIPIRQRLPLAFIKNGGSDAASTEEIAYLCDDTIKLKSGLLVPGTESWLLLLELYDGLSETES